MVSNVDQCLQRKVVRELSKELSKELSRELSREFTVSKNLISWTYTPKYTKRFDMLTFSDLTNDYFAVLRPNM